MRHSTTKNLSDGVARVRLTRRCSGLATLAAELHFVRSRPGRERQAFPACWSPQFTKCNSLLVSEPPCQVLIVPSLLQRASPEFLARASRPISLPCQPFLLFGLPCKDETRRERFCFGVQHRCIVSATLRTRSWAGLPLHRNAHQRSRPSQGSTFSGNTRPNPSLQRTHCVRR